MTSTQIAAVLDQNLPVVFVATNPKSVRQLANRAGRPYAARLDEILAAFAESRASNQDLAPHDFTFRHAGRTITVYYARVRGLGSGDTPKTRVLAVSVETALATDPDRLLTEYIEKLNGAIAHRGPDADALLAEVTGADLKWNADA